MKAQAQLAEVSAARGKLPPATFAVALVFVALTLSGCDVPHIDGFLPGGINVPRHKVPYWRQKQNYYTKFVHQVPNAPGPHPTHLFNSCMDPAMDLLSVCNGRGACTPFDRDVDHPIWFCLCDYDWGGPECQTPRRRQTTAWFLSLLLGPLGVDEMYLGWPIAAICKLMFGGYAAGLVFLGHPIPGAAVLVAPWMYDVVRIGSAPVLAAEYRVAADLPRWIFVVLTLVFYSFIAFGFGLRAIYTKITHRRFNSDMETNYGAFGKASAGSA